MIHIQIVRRWKYNETPDGSAVREFPPGRTYTVDEDVGLLAIADGAAEALEPLNEDQQRHLDLIKAAAANDEAAVAALLQGSEAEADAPAKTRRRK